MPSFKLHEATYNHLFEKGFAVFATPSFLKQGVKVLYPDHGRQVYGTVKVSKLLDLEPSKLSSIVPQYHMDSGFTAEAWAQHLSKFHNNCRIVLYRIELIKERKIGIREVG